MILACAFLYQSDPGGAGLIDLERLKVGAPEIAQKIVAQIEAAKTSSFGNEAELAAKNYYEITLPYGDCQATAMREAGVDAPCQVDAVVTVFVE